MVIKLIKNGFIDSWQSFRNVILSVVIAFAMLTLLTFTSDSSASWLFASLLSIAMFALIVASLVLSIMAFISLLYRSLYREESYRAFTQPVASWEIFVSKVVLAISWSIIISLVVMVSSGLSFMIIFRDVSEIFGLFGDFFSYVFSFVDWSLLIVWIVESLVSGIFTISLFLLVGAIVNSSRFQNRRVMWFVIIYLAIVYVFGQIVGRFDATTMNFILNPGFETAIEAATYTGYINWADFFSLTVNGAGVQTLLLITLLKGLLAGLMGFGTVWLWDHKLEVID